MDSENTDLSLKKTNWLERLKDESWEAELLVSAVAIYAILQAFDLLDWLIIQFIDYLDPGQYLIGYFIIVCGFLAIGILTAMFAIHFAFRAYWIGLVGLNSVFPDYSLEDSAYSPIYTKKILAILPKLTTSIDKVDELCSVIFSAAFGLMLIYSFITITSSLYLLIFNILSELLPPNLSWILWIPLLLFGILMVFGIFISIPANLKRFHGNETIQHLYFVYVRWASIFTYGPIYKTVMQISMIFGSNFKRKKGLIKMVVFMLIIGLFFGCSKMLNSDFYYLLNFERKQDITRMESYYYQENNKDIDFLLAPEINGAIVNQNTLRVFIPIYANEVKTLEKICALEKVPSIGDETQADFQENRNEYLDCYTTNHPVFLNNELVDLPFLKTDHPVTGQFGILGHLDVSNLARGNQNLKITKKGTDEKPKEWNIPFFYAPN